MIFDELKNFKEYTSLYSGFKLVDEYLSNNDLKLLEPGNYKIDGDKIYIIVVEGKPNPAANPKIEVHRKYIDIQITIEGSFKLGWKELKDCKQINKEYDAESDYMLYDDAPEFATELLPGSFMVFFPDDAHIVYSPETYVKKAIVKVMVDY